MQATLEQCGEYNHEHESAATVIRQRCLVMDVTS